MVDLKFDVDQAKKNQSEITNVELEHGINQGGLNLNETWFPHQFVNSVYSNIYIFMRIYI